MYYYRRFFINKFCFLLTFFLICMFANFLNAQSGRRVKSPPPPAPEVSNPEPKTETTVKEQVKPLHKLKIYSDTKGVGFSQFYFPKRMSRWITDRLQDSLLLEVSTGSEASLSEAKKMAKNTTEIFLVLVELDEDQYLGPTRSRSNSINGEISIKYHVLEPVTGNTKFYGQVVLYPDNRTIGGGILNDKGLCYPEVTGNEKYLLQASIETAERIMSSFKIPIPSYKCLPKI